SALTLLATQRRENGIPNVLMIGAVALFSGLTIAGMVWSADSRWLTLNSRAVAALGFTVIAILSLGDEPFTEFDIRPNTRPSVWGTSRFVHLNTRITSLCAATFAFMATGHLVAPWVSSSSASTVFNWVLPICLAVLAMHRSRLIWNDYVD